MFGRRRQEQARAFEERKVLCADEESAKAEAARQQERESEVDVRWNHVVRGGQWYALRYLDQPEPLWRAFILGGGWLVP